MTKSIQVEDNLHVDLMTLKGIRNIRNMTDLIRELLEKRGYNEEFFERVRVKVSE